MIHAKEELIYSFAPGQMLRNLLCWLATQPAFLISSLNATCYHKNKVKNNKTQESIKILIRKCVGFESF